jgi:pimeloyl-ACP methyl ester carboxylesterase
VRRSFRILSTLAPPLAARVAWHLFAKPPRRIRDDRYGVMSEARAFTLRAEGHRLAAWRWGEGPTVLLHHGWGSSSASLGAFVRPLVESGFSVVAYDAHAHGRSPGVTTSGPEMARHLGEIASTLEARHLVGHSMGTVVTGFALKRGLELDRMALLNGPADMPYFLTIFADSLGLTEAVTGRMIRKFEREHSLSWEECVVEWVAEGQDIPTLLVHDVRDPDVPWPHAERVRSAWKNRHAITTRGLGHRGALHAREIVEAVVRFLRGDDEELPTEVVASPGTA